MKEMQQIQVFIIYSIVTTLEMEDESKFKKPQSLMGEKGLWKYYTW